MSRRIFVGLDDEARAKRSLIFAALIVVFLSSVGLASAFVAGYEYRNYLAIEEKRAEAMKPRKANPARYVPLLGCTAQDFREHLYACKSRDRMSKVGQ